MARELIEESSYGPETLKVLYQAFDEAWETMAEKYANDPDLAEIARIKLANSILSFPVDEITTAKQIRELIAPDHGARQWRIAKIALP